MKHSHCIGCDRPMRTKSMDKEKFPGTRVHAARGKCGSCYELDRTKRDGDRPHRGPNTTTRGMGARPTVESLLAERDRFNEARRKRGVPKEGLLFARQPIDA